MVMKVDGMRIWVAAMNKCLLRNAELVAVIAKVKQVEFSLYDGSPIEHTFSGGGGLCFTGF